MKMKRLLVFLIIGILLVPLSGAAENLPLSEGSKGGDVLSVKQRLQELRYLKKASLTGTYTEKTADAIRAFQRQNGLPETGAVDAATWEALFSASALPQPYPTMPPLAAQAPLSDPDWPERDAGGFLVDEGEYFYENDEEGLWIYLGHDLQVIITRGTDRSVPLVWFETEIFTRGSETFRTVQTDPDHPGRKFQYPYVISREAGFVLGFSDDFFATRMADHETVGIIIRDGKIISSATNRKSGHHLPNLDMLVQYPDGRFEVCRCTEYTAEQLLEKGAVNVFSFGPILLRNGEINELLYTYYRSIEPRHALGMIEPGHYLLVSVQGRTSESKGTVLQQVAEMMQARGVREALNLDGGNTMALVFRGRMLNKLATYKNKKFVRTVTSLIGIGYTENQSD